MTLWTPQEPRSFTVPASLSPGKPIPGIRILTKKRQLFPGPPPTSPVSFALPHWLPKELSPCLGLGILTQFPFGLFSQYHYLHGVLTATFKTDFSDSLGPTDPCSTAVHMEPFSTLVLKGLT